MAPNAIVSLTTILLSFTIAYGDDLTSAEKAAILQVHNDARDLVADGCHKSEAYPSDFQPPAKDNTINHLIWDDALAANALVLAEKCEMAHSGDTINNLDSSWSWDGELKSWETRLGENIAVTSVTSPSYVEPKEMAYGWIDERRAYSYGTLGCTAKCDTTYDPNDITSCGHYTQAIWAETTRVGCGLQTNCGKITNWGRSGSVLVCQYFMAGNMGSSSACKSYAEAPYETGTNSKSCDGDEDTSSDSLCDTVPKCIQMEGFRWDRHGRKYDGTWNYAGCHGGNTPYYQAKLKKDIYNTGDSVYMCLWENTFWKLTTDPSCEGKYVGICPTNNIMECAGNPQFWRVYTKKEKDPDTGEVLKWIKTKQKRVTVNECGAMEMTCDDGYDAIVCVAGDNIISAEVVKVDFNEFRCLNDRKAYVYNDSAGNENYLYWSTEEKWVLSKIELEEDPLYVLAECEHQDLMDCTEDEWIMNMDQRMAESFGVMSVYEGSCDGSESSGKQMNSEGTITTIAVIVLSGLCVLGIAIVLCIFCFVRNNRKGIKVSDKEIEDEHDVELPMPTGGQTETGV